VKPNCWGRGIKLASTIPGIRHERCPPFASCEHGCSSVPDLGLRFSRTVKVDAELRWAFCRWALGLRVFCTTFSRPTWHGLPRTMRIRHEESTVAIRRRACGGGVAQCRRRCASGTRTQAVRAWVTLDATFCRLAAYLLCVLTKEALLRTPRQVGGHSANVQTNVSRKRLAR
jgi:hypothetical protein